MSNPSRVSKMAQEITDIAEFRKSGLRYEKHFCWLSLLLYIVVILIPVGICLISK